MRIRTAAASNRATRRGLRGATAALCLATAALFAAAAPAAAHDELLDTALVMAESGETTAFTLTYSNNIVPIGTEVHVTDAQGANAAKGDPKVSGREVTQDLEAPLPDGRYDAVWRVVSSDGHPIEGGFSFDISDGASTEVLPLSDEFGAAEGEQEAEHEHADGEDAGTPAWVLPTVIVGGVVLVGAIVVAVVANRRRS